MHPEDRVLVAIMNNQQDWQLLQSEAWYRIPVRHAPPEVPYIDWLAFYFTAQFGSDKWAVHYFARVLGHELVSRKMLFSNQANHPRAGDWYYKMQLGPLQHKLPPIASHAWRRVTFILTSGDRFEAARDLKDLHDDESPAGLRYVTLKEQGFDG